MRPSDKPGVSPATIMVADDDVAFREMLVFALEAHGLATIAVGNIKDAVRHLQSGTVSLLLLDLGLGAENGLALLQTVRSLPTCASLPVILLTGRADHKSVAQTAAFGVQGYVLKAQLSRHDLMTRISRELNLETTDPTAAPVPTAPSQRARPAVSATPDAHAGRSAGEALRSLKPILSREQTLSHVDKCAEMRALSPTVAQLISMTADADCTLDQIARVIRRDQVITLKVLKLANSVVYSRGGPVDTVNKALSRIGVAQIRQVVLNISVIDNFNVRGLSEHFTSELFWEHSIATGLIAAAIARFRRADEREIDRAFTMGLLHDVARMIFAERLGEMYSRVLDAASRLQLPLEQVESRMLLLNHAELMDRVLNAWAFPQPLVDPIAMHHLSAGNIRSVAPTVVEEASTLALANRFAHSMLLGSSGNEAQCSTAEFVQLLGLGSEALKFIEEQIPEQTAEMKSTMLQSASATGGTEYRQIVLRSFRQPIRPLYVSANPELDGFRMLFERLRHPTAGQRPNIAIVYLANVNERESLFNALREREVQSGMDKLPLVIVAPAADFAVEPRLVAGRMHEVIPTPFTISRLADVMNGLIPPDGEA